MSGHRVSYSKETKERAKREGKGLITLDIVKPGVGRTTIQVIASEEELKQMDDVMLKLSAW